MNIPNRASCHHFIRCSRVASPAAGAAGIAPAAAAATLIICRQSRRVIRKAQFIAKYSLPPGDSRPLSFVPLCGMRPVLLLCLSLSAFAQGTTPRSNPEDYPVHAETRSGAIGAEFMLHSFSAGEQTYLVRNYIVIEVALYPLEAKTVDVHSGNFMVRINGKKQELLPQPSSIVSAAVAHPEWDGPSPVELGAGAGPATVTLGQPRLPQIPGMPIPGQGTAPTRVPRDDPSGLPPRERVKPEQLVLDTALPQGESRRPVSGFLYYAYPGKSSSIKSLELRYEGAVLKLR